MAEVADARIEHELEGGDDKVVSIVFMVEPDGRTQSLELNTHTNLQTVLKTIATKLNVDLYSIAIPQLDDGT